MPCMPNGLFLPHKSVPFEEVLSYRELSVPDSSAFPNPAEVGPMMYSGTRSRGAFLRLHQKNNAPRIATTATANTPIAMLAFAPIVRDPGVELWVAL